jgi:hypothetical protein
VAQQNLNVVQIGSILALPAGKGVTTVMQREVLDACSLTRSPESRIEAKSRGGSE